jgi:hypothetical protein
VAVIAVTADPTLPAVLALSDYVSTTLVRIAICDDALRRDLVVLRFH